MADPARPLSREHWLKSQEILARVLRGEQVPQEELIDAPPPYQCPECQDTGFVLTKALDDTVHSRRCARCKPAMDAAIRKSARHQEIEVPDDPAPVERDWKQAAGMDDKEE